MAYNVCALKNSLLIINVNVLSAYWTYIRMLYAKKNGQGQNHAPKTFHNDIINKKTILLKDLKGVQW